MADAQTPKPAAGETRREAVSTTLSDKVQDGRGVDIATGQKKSAADRVVFQQTRLKTVNGHTVLTDHLTGTEQLADLQADIEDNPEAPKSQWRW